jgi:hypothetical protein
MKKALVIGINDYPKYSLRCCENDANVIAKLLERNDDDSKNFEVHQLTKNVTRKKIRAKLKELYNDKGEVLFYFSGHGLITDNDVYLATPDSFDTEDGISLNEILKLANDAEAHNKIIILDCCFSGAMGSPSVFSSNESLLNDGVTILTASRKNEPSYEINGHGVFTNLLIGALEGGASDILGNITAGNIYSYIDRALGEWGQRPTFKTNVTRFLPLRKSKPLIELQKLRKITSYFEDENYEYPLDRSFEDTEPEAIEKNVKIFKILQKYTSLGLVCPCGEDHMYYAAINSKACKLSNLGKHYWRLVKEERI